MTDGRQPARPPARVSEVVPPAALWPWHLAFWQHAAYDAGVGVCGCVCVFVLFFVHISCIIFECFTAWSIVFYSILTSLFSPVLTVAAVNVPVSLSLFRIINSSNYWFYGCFPMDYQGTHPGARVHYETRWQLAIKCLMSAFVLTFSQNPMFTSKCGIDINGALGRRIGHLGRVKTTMILNCSSGAGWDRCARLVIELIWLCSLKYG